MTLLYMFDLNLSGKRVMIRGLAAVERYGVSGRISYMSTGGGSFLEFVEGKTLPAVSALEERARELSPAANCAPAAIRTRADARLVSGGTRSVMCGN